MLKEKHKYNVNQTKVFIDPNKHIGEQLQKVRQNKGISVQAATDALSVLTGEKQNRQTWYNYENKTDIGLAALVQLFAAIGIIDVVMDDHKSFKQ